MLDTRTTRQIQKYKIIQQYEENAANDGKTAVTNSTSFRSENIY